MSSVKFNTPSEYALKTHQIWKVFYAKQTIKIIGDRLQTKVPLIYRITLLTEILVLVYEQRKTVT